MPRGCRREEGPGVARSHPEDSRGPPGPGPGGSQWPREPPASPGVLRGQRAEKRRVWQPV